jgi:hypothetical protein
VTTYDVGDAVRITASFSDPDTDAPVVPMTVNCRVKLPVGEVVEVLMSPVDGSPGTYRGTYVAEGAGEHVYRVWTEQPYAAAAEGRFSVRASAF